MHESKGILGDDDGLRILNLAEEEGANDMTKFDVYCSKQT